MYLVATANGARILTNRGTESFTGATIHDSLRRLASRLDGTSTMDELTAGLDPERRAMVERIVALLMREGIATDGEPLEPRGELGYLDSFVPDAEAAYRRYREADIVVVGAGAVVGELLDVLARSGATRLTALVTTDLPTDLPSELPTGLPSEAGGNRSVVRRVELDELPGALAELTPDLVVQVAGADQALDLGRWCRAGGVRIVHGARVGDELWIGTDWESAWRRLGSPADLPATGEWMPEEAALVAAMVGMAAFRELTGCAAPDDGLVCARPGQLETTVLEDTVPADTVLEDTVLEDTVHRCLPHFAARAANGPYDALDTITALAAGPVLSPEQLDAAGARLVDPRLGVIRELSERDFAQLPLNVTAAVLADDPPRLVTGAALGVREARWRAVLGAIAAYAASVVDPARLVPSEDGGLAMGQRLGGGDRLVNATDVFTPLGRPQPGVVAGFDWSSAVLAGLLDCCAHRTAMTVGRRGALTVLDPWELRPDGEARASLELLDLLGVRPVVHDVTGPLLAPTLAFSAAGRTIAYSSGLTASAALADGLRAVVLDEQSRRNAQPEYAPPPVPQLPVLAPAGPGEPPPGCTQAQLVDAFGVLGGDVLVVPLDHDRELHKIMPYVLRVVIVDS